MTGKTIRILVVATLLIALLCAMATPAMAHSYNRQAAANYALQYAENPNPAYMDYTYCGGDCTNFVSQSLLAGGWRETGKYIYYSKYAWYYDGADVPWRSRSWTSATNLYRFMLYTTRATSVGSADQMDIGDVFQIDYDRNGVWDHSMIVTGKDHRGLLMSYHTANTKNEPLADIINRNSGARFAGWHIKDNYNQ